MGISDWSSDVCSSDLVGSEHSHSSVAELCGGTSTSFSHDWMAVHKPVAYRRVRTVGNGRGGYVHWRVCSWPALGRGGTRRSLWGSGGLCVGNACLRSCKSVRCASHIKKNNQKY